MSFTFSHPILDAVTFENCSRDHYLSIQNNRNHAHNLLEQVSHLSRPSFLSVTSLPYDLEAPEGEEGGGDGTCIDCPHCTAQTIPEVTGITIAYSPG